MKGGGLLRIAARIENRDLVLQVDNPRPVEPVSTSTPGVGLRNATARLRLLYGDRASLALDLTAGHATAVVRLPA
jgi:LytS/YehU family sensor histidine kinase